MRDAGSDTGVNSRSLPCSVRPASAGISTAHCSVARAVATSDSGMLMATSRSPVCATRITDWPAATTWPALGVDRGDHAGGVGHQRLELERVAGLAQLRLRRVEPRGGRVERGLLPIELRLADVVLLAQVAQPLRIPPLRGRRRCGGHELRLLGVDGGRDVGRVESREHRPRDHAITHRNRPLRELAADSEPVTRLDSGSHLAGQRQRDGDLPRLGDDRAHGARGSARGATSARWQPATPSIAAVRVRIGTARMAAH